MLKQFMIMNWLLYLHFLSIKREMGSFEKNESIDKYLIYESSVREIDPDDYGNMYI